MISLDGKCLGIEDLCRVARGQDSASIAPHALERMRRSREVVERLAGGERPICAVNEFVQWWPKGCAICSCAASRR